MGRETDMRNDLEQNHALLLVTSAEDHDSLFRLLGMLKKKKICFVTLNRTYESVTDSLKGAGLDPDDAFIIDCVTSSFSSVKPPSNVILLPSPDALTELNIAIIETLKNEKCDYLVFDSISTLLTYREGPLVARFIDFLTGKARDLKSRAVFTCIEGDFETTALHEITLHMDKVIKAKSPL